MFSGFLYGVGACLIWGTVYVIPELLSDHSPLWISLLRYAVFGFFCALMLAVKRRDAARLSRRDWLEAALLGIVGNLAGAVVMSLLYEYKRSVDEVNREQQEAEEASERRHAHHHHSHETEE